jgi:TonB-dependent starch-binding outer membrane protein SusC
MQKNQYALARRNAGAFTQTLRIMRLMTIFLTIFCIQLSARTISQEVSFSGKNVSLEKVFASVRQQTGYVFFFKKNIIKEARPVTINVMRQPLSAFLNTIFENQPFEYTIEDGNVFVRNKVVAGLSPKLIIDIPPIDIKGRVINDKGEPVAGATVMIKGSKRATSTDADGNFMLNGVEEKAQLIITGANIENYEMNIKGQSLLNLIVQQKLSPLDQVQIIAYGTTTKRLGTGSVSTVKAVDIEKQPVTSPLLALQGRVPGLLIEQSSGLPGASYKVEIRGQSHLDGFGKTSDPFYVVDGVPYVSRLSGSLNNALIGNSPLNFINPLDIESISVLKDADATSIYGSRAANGAIIITTKKGKAGAMAVGLNISYGFTKPKPGLTMLNTQQYLDMRREAFKNDNLTPGIADYDVNGVWDTTRYTDFSKLLTQNTAHFTNAQVTVSGGNASTQYTVGADYSRQETGFPSIVKDNGADQKASLHFSLNTSSQDNKFKLSLIGNYQTGKNMVPSNGSVFSQVFPPDLPPFYKEDGSLNWAPITPGQPGTFLNPLSFFYQSYKGLATNLISNAVVSYTLIKNLDIKSTFGYTNFRGDEYRLEPIKGTDPGRKRTSGTSAFQFISGRSWIIEPQLNYQVQIGKNSITALLGSSLQERIDETQRFSASGFSNDALLTSIQAATNLSKQSTNAQYKYAAVFGRLSYNFDNRYLLNLNVRRDGSSRFGPGRQFHTFASVGGSYIFSETRLIKDHFSFLSFGKFRGSYGTSGSDAFSNYQFLDLFTTIGGDGSLLPYQNGNGLFPESHYNPDLAWEESKKLDLAIELGFLKDRITIEAVYYRKRSGNQLVTSPISGVTGFPSIPQNLPALVQNSGIEFVLNTTNISTKNFQWTSSFNISTNKQKLIEFPNIEATSYNDRYIVGQPLNIVKLFDYQGVNSATGLYQFRDRNGNITSSVDYLTDKIIIANLSPKYFGGLQNNLRYRNFDLSFFLQFVNQTGKNINDNFQFAGFSKQNIPTFMLNRWQKPGDVAEYQKYYTTGSGPAQSAFGFAKESKWVYGPASFIRLKNLAFSWQVPQNWDQKLRLKNASLFIQGQNLLVITNYKGLDPETKGSNFPPVRTWVAGVRASF